MAECLTLDSTKIGHPNAHVAKRTAAAECHPLTDTGRLLLLVLLMRRVHRPVQCGRRLRA
jgi:hypothetical protein